MQRYDDVRSRAEEEAEEAGVGTRGSTEKQKLAMRRSRKLR
jgi:hypothetical protein